MQVRSILRLARLLISLLRAVVQIRLILFKWRMENSTYFSEQTIRAKFDQFLTGKIDKTNLTLEPKIVSV